ncbi:hypothetical protein Godav_014759 [Gossypium davidsonii]|uniref:Uncharacterized protein n=1 Tax=Gossypium davidsonii TaxID=34287 RepID=A0A7J8RLK4_GOSDV|nr:hypothetical protein [Gossypium davidsonii]
MKIEGCDFFWWVEGNSDGTDSTAEEQGCTIDEIVLQNKMLLTENERLRLENDELNIDEMRRMKLKITRLEEKITLYKAKMSRNNKVIVAYKLLLVVSWMVFWGYLACGWLAWWEELIVLNELVVMMQMLQMQIFKEDLVEQD